MKECLSIKCEMCGELSPPTDIEDDVIDLAVDAGWETNGTNDFDRDLCPSCVAANKHNAKWDELGFHTLTVGPPINMLELKRRRFGR